MDDNKELNQIIEEEALDRINKANALSFMLNTEGWGILLETFEEMKHKQLEVMSEQIPGDEKGILAAHAVWYSVVHTLDNITQAINSAIQSGEEARSTLKEMRHEDEY